MKWSHNGLNNQQPSKTSYLLPKSPPKNSSYTVPAEIKYYDHVGNEVEGPIPLNSAPPLPNVHVGDMISTLPFEQLNTYILWLQGRIEWLESEVYALRKKNNNSDFLNFPILSSGVFDTGSYAPLKPDGSDGDPYFSFPGPLEKQEKEEENPKALYGVVLEVDRENIPMLRHIGSSNDLAADIACKYLNIPPDTKEKIYVEMCDDFMTHVLLIKITSDTKLQGLEYHVPGGKFPVQHITKKQLEWLIP